MTTDAVNEEQTTEPNMPQDNEKTLVSIKFRAAGKQYDFDANGLELAENDVVVVDTNRGRALGTVAKAPYAAAPHQQPADLKKVVRLASEADQNMARISSLKEKEAHDHCFTRIRQRNMAMKLVKAEYLFDGSKIIFYFTADGRVDFRELVKDLAHHFHTRIEMRQIGVRDEAKLLGGIGICGRELCCTTFLADFHPVSVRMAKQQGLALNPTKISGQCGRLLCCLGYEYDTYCSMAKKLPKQGSKITVDGQTAEVLSTQTLAQTVTVRCEGKVQYGIAMSKVSSCKCALNKHPEEPAQPEANTLQTPPLADAAKAPSSPRRSENRPTTRGARNAKPAETTPSRPARPPRTGKATDNRPPRPRKGQERGPAALPEEQAVTKQRPTRPQPPAKASVATESSSTPATTPAENAENKPIKRRSRNRRRPPRKP